MSIAELKIELINRITIVDKESVLKEVLSFLEEGKNPNKNASLNLSKNYEAIKSQYNDVLEKLSK